MDSGTSFSKRVKCFGAGYIINKKSPDVPVGFMDCNGEEGAVLELGVFRTRPVIVVQFDDKAHPVYFHPNQIQEIKDDATTQPQHPA
jgi:hypothetical protein